MITSIRQTATAAQSDGRNEAFVEATLESHALIINLVAALALAFFFGALAQKLRISPLVGYLVAGVAMGPFTPGYVGDTSLAMQFAEIGVILLMFGVGLKFSLSDLWAVKGVAIPGALVQMAAATLLGYGVGALMGLGAAEALMLGFSLSVASTVVLPVLGKLADLIGARFIFLSSLVLFLRDYLNRQSQTELVQCAHCGTSQLLLLQQQFLVIVFQQLLIRINIHVIEATERGIGIHGTGSGQRRTSSRLIGLGQIWCGTLFGAV